MRKRFKRAISIERDYVNTAKDLHVAFSKLRANHIQCTTCPNEFHNNHEQCNKLMNEIGDLVKKEDEITEMLEISGDLVTKY
jgi:hypothetical protein